MIRRALTLEPSLVRGAVVAVFALLSASGVAWASPDHAALIVGAILAVAALVQGVWTRSAVTPNAKVPVATPTPNVGA